MKKMTRFLAIALSAALAAGTFAPVSAEAASKTISRVGKEKRTVYTGSDFELEVKKKGSFSDNKIKWSIGNTKIVKFDDDDRYDDEIELRAVKAGTTTVTAKNLLNGKKIKYKITVKKSTNGMSRVGESKRSVTAGKEFELEVKKKGSYSDNKIKWSIANTKIVKFDDDDRKDNDIELKAVKAGTTTVTAKNLITGKKISYKITVKKPKSNYSIKKVGSSTKTVEDDDDIDLKVTKGSSLKASQIKWSIADTSILRFEDGDKTGTKVEIEAKKVGKTKVTAKNTKTGEKVVYTIKVVPEYDDDDDD